MAMRVGRIPYINCYPVYGGIDRGMVAMPGELVDGVPTALNRAMAHGELDVSVISAVEYARDATKYLLLPGLSICCDGPVRSVVLFSKRPAAELTGRRVLVSRSSMTSVALLELLFDSVWDARPTFIPSNAELTDVARFGEEAHDARLVIGDAALHLWSRLRCPSSIRPTAGYPPTVRLRSWRRVEAVDGLAVRVRRVGRAADLARRGRARSSCCAASHPAIGVYCTSTRSRPRPQSRRACTRRCAASICRDWTTDCPTRTSRVSRSSSVVSWRRVRFQMGRWLSWRPSRRAVAGP